MKRKRFIWRILLCCIILAAGCRQKAEEAGKEEKTAFQEPLYDWNEKYEEPLVVWGISPDLERPYIQKAFERYEELTGNTLDIVQMPKEEFGSAMKEAFSGGSETPDIVFSYGGTNIEQYDPDENFYDFSEAAWVEDLTDTSINQTVYHGRIIGLPHWEASVSGTLYNKEIFKKYGLEIPYTQEEFMEVCEVLLKAGITPLYLPCREISMLLYQFPMDFIVEDTAVLKGLNDGSILYADIPRMKEVVGWYRMMAERGYLGSGYMENDWDGMETAMSSGKYAMMLCWDTWLYTDFNGDPEDFGLMPAFIGVPEEGTFEGPNLGLFMVSRKSHKLDSALQFITFLADPYNYNIAFENIYTAPVFKNQVASISTPQYQDAERLIERHFRDSTAWLRVRGFSQMDAACILEYMEPGSSVTAEECLKKMDRLRYERLGR